MKGSTFSVVLDLGVLTGESWEMTAGAQKLPESGALSWPPFKSSGGGTLARLSREACRSAFPCRASRGEQAISFTKRETLTVIVTESMSLLAYPPLCRQIAGTLKQNAGAC